MATVNLGKDSSGRKLTVDRTTLDKVRWAERRLGIKLTIVQGSYMGSSGASASANTHKGGGVIDIRTHDLPRRVSPQLLVKYLRWAGFVAWYRTKAQGFDPHIHAIDYGNPKLHSSAKHQVNEWAAGRNGLASGGKDDGARVTVPKRVPPEPNAKVLRAAQINAALLSPVKKSLAQVKVLQILLQQVGLYSAAVDGKAGPVTRNAVRAYQKRIGYKQHGLVGRWMLHSLLNAAENKTWSAAD